MHKEIDQIDAKFRDTGWDQCDDIFSELGWIGR